MRTGRNGGWDWSFSYAIAVLVAASLPALGGCEAALGGGDRPVRITFSSWGSAQELTLYHEVIRRFEQANPDIRVSPLFIPFGSYFTKVQLLFVGGVGPDVMLLSSPMVYQLKVHGHIENLQPYVDRERASDPGYLTEDEYYIESLQPACTFDGDFHYLPMGPMSMHLYYNKTLFEAAGVPCPREGWTWDEFRDAARRLTVRQGNRTPQWGVLVSNWEALWRTFLLQNGADVFDDAMHPTRCLLDSPEAIETFGFLQDLIYTDRSAPTPAQVSQMGGDFLTGRVAMQIHGTWMVEQYRRIGEFEWDMAPLPTRKRYGNVVSVGGMAMARASRNKEAAWRFMQHLFSDETQRYMGSRSATWQPMRKRLAACVDEVPGVPEHHHLRFEELRRAVPGEVLRHPQARQLQDLLSQELEPVFLGTAGPAEHLPAVARKVNAFLAKHRANP